MRRRELRIVFASWELAPLAQTGGLGDMASGLARALAVRGHQVTCLLPAHRDVLRHPACPTLVPAGAVRIATPGAELIGRWLVGELAGIRLQLLDIPALYDRPELYGAADVAEAQRYIALSRAAAEFAATTRPHVLVAHDWHAALALCALRTCHDFGAARGVGAVQVVHNNAFLGRFPAAAFGATGLPSELFHPDALEFWGDLALLKGGLAWADRIVAVSPNYAQEVQTPAFGEGIDGLYRFRARRLLGIANGIDTQSHDPETDASLPARYGAEYPKPKGVCRKALLDATGLEAPQPGRLLAAVGRLAAQKGWDVLVAALAKLVDGGASLVLLGDGDPGLALQLREAATRWPKRVHVTIGWDDALARRIYAGADCVLAPSRFEPCGLVQLLGQRYGTLPIAHRVGGFVDTIEDGETGILFEPLTPAAIAEAVDRAAALMQERSEVAVQRRLLSVDVSWATPAAAWDRVFAAVAREAAQRI
ncbi:MAG: glycogen/starch synthase [Proteobacteria bacterium]|nr:glycogen/starch synthase [Pseudomonadota bacterium]